MYVCMYACMHACMHACMYVCMSVCVCVCLCAYTYTYTYTYIYIYIYACLCVWARVCVHTCTHVQRRFLSCYLYQLHQAAEVMAFCCDSESCLLTPKSPRTMFRASSLKRDDDTDVAWSQASRTLRLRCIRTTQNIPKHPKISKNTPEYPKITQSTPKCPKTS